ncbi:MAG: hypothetical protein PVTTEEND_000078, partial [Candidatus Fervidibacter sp.]
MVAVQLKGVVKWLGKTLVLRGVDLTVEGGEFFFVLGPSGCGKTTLLRIIAGFLVPDEGQVFFGVGEVTTVPPHKRNAAMVFQHYALFPHMTVWDNVAYGLRLRKLPRDETERRVREALKLVRLEGFERRYPSQLSGGQQQRVALARAIAVHPDVLLLDEPLSNLDAKLRAEMRGELKALQRQLGVTAIYVTHDQKEALAMADRMAVMKDGMILQVGTPTELYRRPASRFVAEFLGDANIWDGRLVALHADGAEVETPFGRLRCPRPDFPVQVGDAVWVMVRPEAVQVTRGDEGTSAENTFVARRPPAGAFSRGGGGGLWGGVGSNEKPGASALPGVAAR